MGISILVKGTVGTVIAAGSITLGSMIDWSGSTALNAAKDKIVAQGQNLAQFFDNEGKMKNKIVSMKTELSTLKTQLTALQADLTAALEQHDLDEAQIAELNTQIEAKTIEITDLTAQVEELNNQLASSDSDKSQLAERIVALENELNQANSEAADLQTTVDAAQNYSAMSTADVDALVANDGTSTPPPTEPPTQPAAPQFDLNVKMISGVPWTISQPGFLDLTFDTKNGNVELTNGSSKNYTLTIDGVDSQLRMESMKILGTTAELDKKVVTIKAPSGAEYKVYLTNN